MLQACMHASQPFIAGKQMESLLPARTRERIALPARANSAVLLSLLSHNSLSRSVKYGPGLVPQPSISVPCMITDCTASAGRAG